jgi:hypothetical protein
MVDFEQKGPQFMVYYNIEAKNLKAHESFDVSWLASMVIMREVLLDWQQRLYHYVFHFSH